MESFDVRIGIFQDNRCLVSCRITDRGKTIIPEPTEGSSEKQRINRDWCQLVDVYRAMSLLVGEAVSL